MAQDHIVKSFDEELERLQQIIMRMGGKAERQLSQAVDALVRRDTDLADTIRKQDKEIDAMETELEEAAIKMIALRQPMADDLRVVVSALKIASDLERIGDYAKNIAKRAITISQLPPPASLGTIRRMAQMAQFIIQETLESYSRRDSERALAAWERDKEVDEMYDALFREHLTYMMEDPRTITASTHLIFVAKSIERIGDHATNIAETSYFMTTGERIDSERAKGDRTPFAVVQPSDLKTVQSEE